MVCVWEGREELAQLPLSCLEKPRLKSSGNPLNLDHVRNNSGLNNLVNSQSLKLRDSPPREASESVGEFYPFFCFLRWLLSQGHLHAQGGWKHSGFGWFLSSQSICEEPGGWGVLQGSDWEVEEKCKNPSA